MMATMSFLGIIKLNHKGETMETQNTQPVEGAFISSLKRNNAKIRADRAASISEDTQLLYKRQIEDLQVQIKRLTRDQDGMLDLSPTHADSLVLASDFETQKFIDKDLKIALELRTLEIKLELATKRYVYLFGAL